MQEKIKLSEIAKETGLKVKEVFEKTQEINIEVKTIRASVSEEDANKIMNYIMTGSEPKQNKSNQVKKVKQENSEKKPVEKNTKNNSKTMNRKKKITKTKISSKKENQTSQTKGKTKRCREGNIAHNQILINMNSLFINYTRKMI